MGLLTKLNISVWDPLILLALIGSSWVVCKWVYNIFFHPLRHVPGPLFGRMSFWPSAYYAYKGTRHWYIVDAFKKYGNKIRVEPDTVLFRDPQAYHDIYNSKANTKRGKFYECMMRNENERSTITTTDNAAHAKRRKLLNQAFTDKSLKASAAFMEKHIDRWNELLVSEVGQDGWSPTTDLPARVDTLVFDILGDICYGKSFEIKEPGENPIKAIPHATVKGLQFMNPIMHSPLVSAFPWLRPRGLGKLLEMIRSKEMLFYDEFIDSSVKERLEREKAGEKREDMLHFIFKAKDPETGLPAFRGKELYAEARLLVVAGSDTSSVTMTGVLFYLAQYPEVHKKLLAELTSTFATADEITPGPKLASCKYTRACIDETLRICPSGLGETPREVCPGGIVIKGEYYPAGVNVGTVSWPDNQNADVYGDPEVFRPDRWIVSEDNPPEEVSRIKANFHPFSIGPFNCAGSNFAMQELILMLAKTVHRLEFRLAPEVKYGRFDGGQPRLEFSDAFIAVKTGPLMQFRRRA